MLAIVISSSIGGTAALLGAWLLSALFIVAAGCGVVGMLFSRRATRIAFALVAVIAMVIIVWDCGDWPWFLCWL